MCGLFLFYVATIADWITIKSAKTHKKEKKNSFFAKIFAYVNKM